MSLRRLLALFALVAGTATTGGPAAADPSSLRIAGVSPQVADRGELVTIEGDGFGAHNVRVTLAGEPAVLVSATGRRASFRVPALAPAGEVEIEVRNPGGRVARIGLQVRFDGLTHAVVDEAAAVRVPVGAEGGTIGIAGMTLAIPPGAVPEGTAITVTPLTALRGSPFSQTPIGVKLEPSGLVLLRPATLTVPRPAGPGTLVAFGFNNGGDGLHLVPHTAAEDTATLRVWHFSGAGVTTVSASELQAVLGYLPTPAHELAEQRIAAALASEATGGPPPGPAIFDALVAWRTSSVLRGLDLARTEARLDYFELAFGEWLAWRSYAQEALGHFDSAQSSFVTTATGIDRAVATDAAAAVARVLLPRCTGPGVPLAPLRDVIRLASAVNLDALPTEEQGAEDGSGRNLPDGRNLPTSCVHVDLVGVQHAAAFARNRTNSIVARAQVGFWKGDPSSTVPLRYRLADITAAPVPLASGTSSDGSFQATVDPATLGLRRYELTVELDASGSDAVLRTFFDQRDLAVPVRERLELQALTPTTIGAGGSVSLRLRMAGDGMVGAVVPLAVGGPGSVTPSTVTTGPDGAATAVYTVPADTMVTAATVSAALPDGTSASVAITITTLVLVSVSPSTVTLSPGQSVDLTATVTGTFVTGVTWTATGGEVISTGGSTARYVAGAVSGSFSVTAASIDAPGASATATITIRAPATVGVVHERTDASIAANAFGPQCEPGRTAPHGLTFWSDAMSCSHDGASAGSQTAFTETHSGGRLVSLVASTSAEASAGGTESSFAAAVGRYRVRFRPSSATRITITGSLALSNPTGKADIVLVGGGLVVTRREPFSLLLTAGVTYELQFEAQAVADTAGNYGAASHASYDLRVAFEAP